MDPNAARLRPAMAALAQLHSAWQPPDADWGPAEAVDRRIAALRQREPKKIEHLPATLQPLAQRAAAQLQRWDMPAHRALVPWLGRSLPLQPCLCDIWHDHVLYEHERVTGIVDYGSLRERESIAADLARLLGSMVDDDDLLWKEGLAAYETVRPLSAIDRQLAKLLDWTGVVVAIGNLLDWLASDRLRAEHWPGVVRRLEQLVTRMEKWETKKPLAG
jgi:hypothetical protein